MLLALLLPQVPGTSGSIPWCLVALAWAALCLVDPALGVETETGEQLPARAQCLKPDHGLGVGLAACS